MTRHLFAAALALVLFLTACARHPPSPEAGAARRDEALALLSPGGDTKVDALIARLQGLVKAQPERADLWVALGEAWVRKARDATAPGYYGSAEACARVALVHAKDHAGARALQGMVLLNAHRFEEARLLSEKALAVRPDDVRALGNLSDALLELGREEEAVAAAQRMMDLKPNLPAYSRAAWLLWLQGDVKGAKESARLAIDAGADPRDPEPRAFATVEAAMFFWHAGDLEGADAGFEKALQFLPGFPPALAGRGRVALAEGEDGRAAALLRQAFERSPLVETAWLLADALEGTGDEDGARRLRREILLRGREEDRRTLCQYLAARNERIPEALRLIDEERQTRGGIYTEDARAFALYRAGRLEEARAASDRALRLHTPDARLLFHAGAIRIAQGDRAGYALLEEALRLNPGFDRAGAREARALLAKRR